MPRNKPKIQEPPADEHLGSRFAALVFDDRQEPEPWYQFHVLRSIVTAFYFCYKFLPKSRRLAWQLLRRITGLSSLFRWSITSMSMLYFTSLCLFAGAILISWAWNIWQQSLLRTVCRILLLPII